MIGDLLATTELFIARCFPNCRFGFAKLGAELADGAFGAGLVGQTPLLDEPGPEEHAGKPRDRRDAVATFYGIFIPSQPEPLARPSACAPGTERRPTP